MANREEKIAALKNLMAGRITPDQLPKPQPESSTWHYDGKMYIRLQPETKEPHPSGMQSIEDEFCQYAAKRPDILHIVLDSCSMEMGNMQPFEVYDETAPPVSRQAAKVLKIGVRLPLGRMVPVKASHWIALGQ